jgi:hypothetical protein
MSPSGTRHGCFFGTPLWPGLPRRSDDANGEAASVTFFLSCFGFFFIRAMAPCLVLVDPSRAVQKAVAILLEAAGHVVTAFDDPCEALDKISTHTKRLMPLSPNDYGKLDSSGFGR